MSTSNLNSGGIDFIGLLTILFIGLKLTNHIDWSWLWVLSPLWISGLIVFIILVIMGIAFVISERKRKRIYNKIRR
jgi:predicted tellurium resistance membrane protein TerC